jgi:hypothetical protein
MKIPARWIALASLGLLALAAAGPGVAGAAGPTSTPRSIAYFANYNPDCLGMLIEAGKKGYLTHVNVMFFHLDWRDWAKPAGPCISYNGLYLDDPRLAPLWETIDILRGLNVKVLATFGGWDVGDYGQLLNPDNPNAAIWYEELKAVLTTYHFDGLDMDIEEDYRNPGHQAVVTTNLRTLLENLRWDLGDGFLLTSTPVAADLTSPRHTVSPGIDYKTLMLEGWFDWYNLQFYNDSFGDIWGAFGLPDYDAVLKQNPHIPASKLVAIVLTNELTGSDGYYELLRLTPKFTQLARKHWDFGGAAGWTFVEAQVNSSTALVNQTDPLGWARAISRALHSKDISSVYLLILED